MPLPATSDVLAQFHHNQSVWIARLASGQLHPNHPHPRLFQAGGTAAMHPGSSGVIMLPYRGDDGSLIDHDRALQWLHQRGATDVLVWSMTADSTIDLAMLARGYRVSFEPWWMTRDLTRAIDAPQHEIILATNREIDHLLDSDIPYIVRDQISPMRNLVAQGHREVVWLLAKVDGKLVGQAIVNVTGDHAGLFNVGVHGRYRHRGIGTSLSLVAMHAAKERGASTMNLNSTPMGMSIYEQSGFRYLGHGFTWLRTGPEMTMSPEPHLQHVVMALGTSDIAALAGTDIPTVLPNGMSAQELAARFGQQDSLRHLISRGYVPEIMALWETGLKEEAIAATGNPIAREMAIGSRRARPIHLAIEKGAGSLVLALIEAGADLSARDGEYRATPLDWAHACNKPTIARILAHAGGQ